MWCSIVPISTRYISAETTSHPTASTASIPASWHGLFPHPIHNAVDTYIESLHGDKTVLTAMELPDIKEFNKSRRVNRSKECVPLSAYTTGRGGIPRKTMVPNNRNIRKAPIWSGPSKILCYSIAVVVHIHKFMHPFLSTSAASIRYNQSKHNKTWDILERNSVFARFAFSADR